MFQPFFRSDGHGLGLAIASPAVDLDKGSIRARNTGPGLAVTIDLPLGEMS